MERPKRIQRKRTKGWRMPAGAVSVCRPSRHGNPFRIGGWYIRGDVGGFRLPLRMIFTEAAPGHEDSRFTCISTAAEAVEWFRWYVGTWTDGRREEVARELRGRDLACFCELTEPCHADVLLELANPVTEVWPMGKESGTTGDGGAHDGMPG